MILSGFGVQLEQLGIARLELVRQWRNHPDIRKKMFDQTHITEAMQLAWYERLQTSPDQYFVVTDSQAHPFALINTRNTDVVAGTCEIGLFIGDPQFKGGIQVVAASFVLLDWLFEIRKFPLVWCRCQPTNQQALRYNQALGFRPVEPGVAPSWASPSDAVCWLNLTPEQHHAATHRQRHFLNKLLDPVSSR
jgi:RimJ/RimL family protein N-acetyltransferase